MNRPRLLVAFLVCALSPLAGCYSAQMARPAVAYEAAPKSAAFAPAHTSASSREVARDGSVTLEVCDTEKARAQIEEKAEALGGFVEKNESARMVVRVPTARMKEAADALASIGRVIGGAWSATDITESGDDARAKIKSLQAEVARLKELLTQAKDGEAQARLNAQLQAAQGQLDGLVAQMRAHDDKAAMATLDIRLTLDPALAGLLGDIPVRWVRRIAEVVVQPRTVNLDFVTEDYKSIWYSPSVKAEIPAGFTQFGDTGHVIEAVDADSTRLRITRHDNPGSAGSAFWFPLVRRGVAETPGVSVLEEKDLKAAGHHAAKLIFGGRKVGDKVLVYAVAVAVSDDHVYTVEMWGAPDKLEGWKKPLESCVATLQVR